MSEAKAYTDDAIKNATKEVKMTDRKVNILVKYLATDKELVRLYMHGETFVTAVPFSKANQAYTVLGKPLVYPSDTSMLELLGAGRVTEATMTEARQGMSRDTFLISMDLLRNAVARNRDPEAANNNLETHIGNMVSLIAFSYLRYNPGVSELYDKWLNDNFANRPVVQGVSSPGIEHVIREAIAGPNYLSSLVEGVFDPYEEAFKTHGLEHGVFNEDTRIGYFNAMHIGICLHTYLNNHALI